MRTIELCNGVNLYLDKTSKFKNTKVIVRFSKKITDDSVYWNALTFMLEDKCKKYDSKQKVRAVLDDLYGAKLTVRNRNQGNLTTVAFSCDAINGKFVNEDVFSKQVDLLREFIFNTIIYDDEVASKALNEAKLMLESELIYLKDNPRILANYEATKLYFDYIGFPKPLDIEDLVKLNLDSLRSLYEYMLKEMSVNIFVTGDIDEERVIDIIKEKLHFESRENNYITAVTYDYKGIVEKEVTKDIMQSNIILIYATDYILNRDEYCKLYVLDGLLGSLPTSLLFQEVREKNSLCYSIYSYHNDFSGILNIETSCANDKVELVIEMINKEIEKIQAGDFEDDLLIKTKTAIITNMMKKLDLPTSALSNMSLAASFGDMLDVFKVMDRIKEVSREEVITMAKSIKLMISYVMKGTGGNSHE